MLSRIKRSEWMYAFVSPVCLMAAVIALADDPAATDPAAATATEDPYAIAEGATQEQLEQQFQQLLNMVPTEQTPEAFKTHLRGVQRFVVELQNPERAIGDELLEGAFQIEYQILQVLSVQLGDADAETEMEGFIARLEQDERPVAVSLLETIRTTEKIQQLETMAAEDRTAFIEEIAMSLSGEDNENAVGYAQMVGEQMEYVAPEEAAAVYELFIKYLAEKSDPQSAATAEYFQGKANYLGLLGSEMVVSSTTVDGQPFDIASFKGQNKVVLVDFWATWCGPCIGELPNLKSHYDAYHGQGFEVVGISLDDDPEALKQFIADQQIAWPTLIDSEVANQGWNNPIAQQYGISAIPACILINQEGKVVSLNARGAELGRLLEELLGPPPAPVEPAAP